jgi:hypothetical protein
LYAAATARVHIDLVVLSRAPAPAQVLRGVGNAGPAGRFAGVNRLTLCR